MGELRILVVDDQPEFLTIAKSLLTGTDCRVVATATSSREALQLVPHVDANVVLMDIHMPGTSGFAATKELASHYPDLPVVIVSSCADPQYAVLAQSYGAVGFLSKRDLSPQAVAAMLD